ncbi:tetratricopeptide repeat protein [Thermoflexibacter ruber]|uniref:Uncharacterized protein n=1 Tax=Thermoflexibacter ruber TaxID=1003 RepID=A0A1I2DMT9_9BACT|nr:tetratricopeptide repeat protein [Thermoflexibacter ruber]SFE81952.1 hypothetical protein SAMN04488541_100793 [Thermoflexibacter ruber]
MKESSNPLLEKYITRLLDLQQRSAEQLTQAEIQEIAKEIGLTEQDLAEATQTVKDAIQRSQTYQEAGRWKEAEKELQLAADLQPFDANIESLLASFYLEKWKKFHRSEDFQAMEIHIEKCLSLSPRHAIATQLLKDLDTEKRRKQRNRKIKIALAVVILPFLAVTTLFFLNEIGIFDPTPTGFEGRTYQIPVEFVPHAEAEGVNIAMNYCEIRHSEYTGSNSIDYTCLGKITSQKFEIQTLRLKAEFLNEKQQVVATDDYVWIVNANNAMNRYQDGFTIHPQDRLSLSLGEGFGMIYFKDNQPPTEIKKMRLLVDVIQRYMPPASYPVYPTIPLSWISVPPDYLTFEAKERQNRSIEEQDDATTIHLLNVEITHTGTAPCRELIVQLDWLDLEGKVISSKDIPLISLKHEPFMPNERLIFSEVNYCRSPTFNFPQAFASYQLRIKSAN